MTLIEMLIAMTASLILFGAVMTIFQILGDTVSKSRRLGRLEGDLCSITATLRQDLVGVTANRDSKGLVCAAAPGGITGYFEVIEGPDTDLVGFLAGSVAPYEKWRNLPDANGRKDWLVGDTDDLLFFTTRSANTDPFTGKYEATTTVANEAEVAYFCRPTPGTSNPTLYTLYRRQLLIVGNLQDAPFNVNPGRLTANGGTFTAAHWQTDFYSRFDLSARREGNDFILNTANDLQRRRNRFGHDPASSGFAVADTQPIRPLVISNTNSVLALAGIREGEDVLLNNVLSFDVRLFDPEARARQQLGTARLKPGDLDYWTLGSASNLPLGETVPVDLGYNGCRSSGADAATSRFSDFGATGHPLAGTGTTARVYDTWTSLYMTNNFDDDASGTPDDAGEAPPYPAQLPGIQILIRLYDPDTRSIKQTTISQSFKR